MATIGWRRRRAALGAPRRPRLGLGIYYDPDAFGRFSETVARYFGTARFLVLQTALVATWITWNVAARTLHLDFDPYPFILLNLAFSTQAAYAAPLILLAQNRQEERDRQEMLEDRRTNVRALADTEYLARELAAIRLALGEMPTRDYLSGELDRFDEELRRLRREVARTAALARGAGDAAGPGGRTREAPTPPERP